jgi:hypothetical protein
LEKKDKSLVDGTIFIFLNFDTHTNKCFEKKTRRWFYGWNKTKTYEH